MSLPTGQSKLDVMQRKIARMKQELAEEFKSVMHEAFADFFVQHPKVKTLSWTQFTPYFNDGDACYFSYHSLMDYMCTIEIDGEEIEAEDGPGYGHSWWNTPEGKAAQKAADDLDTLISRFEDELEASFGDHCLVVASIDGFEVEEYDHY